MKRPETVLLALAALALSLPQPAAGDQPRWAIALHGGASSIKRTIAPERRAVYEQALTEALQVGVQVLEGGGSALDATQRVVMNLEDCPLFNAGRGSVFDRAGGHALDASIMDGNTMACGAVAGVKTLKNPIHAARMVMDQTPHVILSGDPAVRFCGGLGAETAPTSYFNVPRRFEQLAKKMRALGLTPPDEPLGGWPQAEEADAFADEVGETVGCVALDSHGALAAATSTGGRTAKMVGRVGDSPVPGAGNYANSAAAVSGTGAGEEYLRFFIAGRCALLVERGEMTLEESVEHCLKDVLQPGDGGLIAVDRDGKVVTSTTTNALPRGVADSSGRFEVGLWYD